jgi:hypothetical protein
MPFDATRISLVQSGEFSSILSGPKNRTISETGRRRVSEHCLLSGALAFPKIGE